LDLTLSVSVEIKPIKLTKWQVEKQQVEKMATFPNNLVSLKIFHFLSKNLSVEQSLIEDINRRAQKLTRENLKLVWTKFSAISYYVLIMCINLSMQMHTHI